MSSPLAKRRRSPFDRALIGVHRQLSHSKRVQLLAECIADEHVRPLGAKRCLDLGCGDMTLAWAVRSLCPETDWTGADIYPLPNELKQLPEWANYRQISDKGDSLPFKAGEFDITLLCDVLHHVPDEDQHCLLAECLRVSRVVVVKDHYEYGLFSRQLLRLMDFVGNYAYGVSVPRRYFTRSSFEELVRKAAGRIERSQVGVNLYGHLPFIGRVLRPDWHFFARVTAAT